MIWRFTVVRWLVFNSCFDCFSVQRANRFVRPDYSVLFVPYPCHFSFQLYLLPYTQNPPSFVDAFSQKKCRCLEINSYRLQISSTGFIPPHPANVRRFGFISITLIAGLIPTCPLLKYCTVSPMISIPTPELRRPSLVHLPAAFFLLYLLES